MLLKLAVKDFRNFKRFVIDFDKPVVVIVGDNATGKTNILEAIHMLAFGKSFKASVEEEMINHKRDIARMYGVVADMPVQAGRTKLEIVLTRGKIKIGTNKYEKTPRKKLLLDGMSKRLFNFAGRLRIVLFSPEDLDIVLESPSVRRKFMDSVLSLTDREYYRALLSYEKGLRQRNKLLWRIREEGLTRSQLVFWDRLLIKNGGYITDQRQEFIDFVNEANEVNDQKFMIKYDKSVISEVRISRYEKEEVASATTLVGPHRDDFIFRHKASGKKMYRNLAKFGSRGEQRMGVLWLKLRELFYIRTTSEVAPILLLDDIFSELDHEHRDIVMDLVGSKKKNEDFVSQVIITTADPHFVKGMRGIKKIVLK
ncbi:DNA replication/repair protein RecF [Patescibacteria group bacterium]